MSEFNLADKEKTIGAELFCYASGNGALSFVYERGGKATGDTVTYRDVKWFVEHRKPELKSWMIGRFSELGPYFLFKPVTRTGPDELNVGGRAYRYERAGLQLWVYSTDHDKRVVNNLDIRAQINFYLDHEKELDEIIYAGGL